MQCRNWVRRLCCAWRRQPAAKDYWAIKDSWFAIDNNQLFCLLGPNGAGKVKSLLRLFTYHLFEIVILGLLPLQQHKTKNGSYMQWEQPWLGKSLSLFMLLDNTTCQKVPDRVDHRKCEQSVLSQACYRLFVWHDRLACVGADNHHQLFDWRHPSIRWGCPGVWRSPEQHRGNGPHSVCDGRVSPV